MVVFWVQKGDAAILNLIGIHSLASINFLMDSLQELLPDRHFCDVFETNRVALFFY